MSNILIQLSILLIALQSWSTAHALNFRATSMYIEAEGTIIPGDAARLVAMLNALPPSDGYPGISLNSPGGSLIEGILLGQAFRQFGVETVVRSGKECHSACAVAFLGGTRQYATGKGVGRTLEVGAHLGFHGFSSTDERVVLINEAFDAARVLNSIVVGYANEMTGIDLALLSNLVTVAPSSIRIVTTPREIRGLSIEVKGGLAPRPTNWGLNACGWEVNRVRPISDGEIEWRISPKSSQTVIGTIAKLRTALLDDLYPPDSSKRDALSRLSPKDFIELTMGSIPKFPVQRIIVQRGAGFYYDSCYAFEGEFSGSNANTLLTSTDGAIKTSSHGQLGWYPERIALWR